MKNYYVIIVGLAFLMNSCYDNELHSITVEIIIENKTHKNLHCIYDTKDYSFSDSIYDIASLNSDGFIQCYIDTIINRDNVLSDAEFSDLVSRFKIFYIENGDTLKINDSFYDGKSCWKSEITKATDGIMFVKYYWWCEYKAVLTSDMFEKQTNPKH